MPVHHDFVCCGKPPGRHVEMWAIQPQVGCARRSFQFSLRATCRGSSSVKRSTTAEFARVLRRGGRIGISELTRCGSLPSELRSHEAWIACVADARAIEEYSILLPETGLNVGITEAYDHTLIDFIERIRSRHRLGRYGLSYL